MNFADLWRILYGTAFTSYGPRNKACRIVSCIFSMVRTSSFFHMASPKNRGFPQVEIRRAIQRKELVLSDSTRYSTKLGSKET